VLPGRAPVGGTGGGGFGGLASCDVTNRVATRAGLAIICLEPLAAMLGTHVIAVRAGARGRGPTQFTTTVVG
jgi:hypothetical protein